MKKKSESQRTGRGGIRILSMLLLMVLLVCCQIPAGVPDSAAAGATLIAFTYDDGPSYFTADLLDGLKERQAAATFFMIGHSETGKNGLEYYPEVADRMVREGHQLANHSYYHIDMNKATPEQVQLQIDHTEKLLFEHMGGEYVDMFRPPLGQVSEAQRKALDVPLIRWSYDCGDKNTSNVNTIYKNIVNNASDGGIIHIHDLNSASVEGSLQAIDTLKKQGYEFVTVAELLRRRGVTPVKGSLYSSAEYKGTNLPAYQAPTISYVRDTEKETSKVSITVAEEGLTLYYTTDGSYPTMASKMYTEAFEINKNVTITVVGYDKWGTRTPAAKQTLINKQTAVPTASTVDGKITLHCDTEDAVMYYTTDGSKPTVEEAERYTGPFRMTGHTLKIIAARPDLSPSEVAVYAVTDDCAVFKDLDVTQWYFPFVSSAVDQKIMNGTDDQVFAPQAQLSRAMMAQILYNLSGRPDIASTDPCRFQDVQESNWFYNAVRWAASEGIVNGISETQFAPNNDITREQMVTMLDRYAKKTGHAGMDGTADLSVFPDAGKIQEYARKAVGSAVAAGLIKGYEDGTLRPGNPITRAEVAAVLVRYTKLT